MTLDEISYNILNLYRGGRGSNNEHITLAQIKFNVKHYRAMLIRRDFERNNLISRHHEQDFGCFELERVDASRCCGLPVECYVSRTKLKVPRTVRFNNRDGITHIADVTGIHTIPLVDPIAVQHLPWDRFTKNDKKAYMIEDHLYLYNADGVDILDIRGIAEDPEELAKYDCHGENCYNKDSIFPLGMDLVEALTNGLVKGTLQLLPLTTSDTEDDTVQQGHVPQVKQSRDGQGDQ